jgi:hypothetical protein
VGGINVGRAVRKEFPQIFIFYDFYWHEHQFCQVPENSRPLPRSKNCLIQDGSTTVDSKMAETDVRLTERAATEFFGC